MELSLPSLVIVCRVKSTVLTLLSFLACNDGIHVSSTVTKRRRNFFGLLLNSSKHCFEVVIRFRLLSTVSKRGTHLADSFVIPKYSCTIFCTGSDEMPTISTISLIFIRRSANTISWILWIISSVVTSIERPGRSLFRTDIRPCLN
jgi:hypothetical protein